MAEDLSVLEGLRPEERAVLDHLHQAGLTPDQINELAAARDAEIQRRYGYAAWALNHPELGPLLRRAANLGWSPQQLQGELTKTAWWQEFDARQREWQRLRAEDPASARAQVETWARRIRITAARMGATIDDAKVGAMAETAITAGWTDADLSYAIAAEQQFSPAGAGGGVGDYQTVRAALVAASQAYLMPLSDATADDWARRVVAGMGTLEGFQAELAAQAKSRYQDPALHAALDSGRTVAQYLEPARQVLARTLEITPDAIDWLDPRWSPVLEHRDGQGARPMTLAEVATWARSQPEFATSRTGQQAAAELALFLGERFAATTA